VRVSCPGVQASVNVREDEERVFTVAQASAAILGADGGGREDKKEVREQRGVVPDVGGY
jgi:hypothetical protein